MEPVRVVLLGASHVHVPDYLEVLRRDPTAVRIAGIHIPGDGTFDAPLDGVTQIPDLARGLAAADAAVVVSTTAEHTDLVPAALAARVPLFVEKPLAADLGSVRALANMIDENPVPFATAMFLRRLPAVRRLRELLSAGALGDLTKVWARFDHPGLLDGWFAGPAAWMLRPEHGSTGGFADLAVHLLDALMWMRPDATLTAAGAAFDHSNGVGVDVGGTAWLRWSGTPTVVQSGWTSRPGGLHLRVEGTAGEATVDGGRLTTVLGTATTIDDGPAPDAGAALDAFLAGLQGRSRWEPPTTREVVSVAELTEELRQIGAEC